MLSNLAMKYDHESAQAAIKEIVKFASAKRSHKLSFLYGARAAMVHGGIPEFLIQEIDSEITKYERNRDDETQEAEIFENGA